MRKLALILGGLALTVLVGGCEDTKQALGVGGKKAPDEFAVYAHAPLSLPPDYALRPPAPVAKRPQDVAARESARRAVFGGNPAGAVANPAPAGSSRGLNDLLARTGALDTDPMIRTIVNRETSVLAEEDVTFTEKLMFWDTPTAYGTIVDADKEAKRVQENQALGRPVTEGKTPSIKKKRKALLEGLFD